MVDGAVRRLAAKVGHGDDVILCETVLCGIAMDHPHAYPNSRERRETVFQLADADERGRYLRLAANTQALFSFCGALVFKRQRWLASPYDGFFIGSCWSHVSRLLALIPGGLRVRLVPEVWSRKRGDNDSFAERGILNRVRIGIEGYLGIAERHFGAAGPEYREVMRLLRAEYTLRCLLAQKVLMHLTGRAEDIPGLILLARRIRSEPTLSNLYARACLRIAPVGLLVPLRRMAWWLRGRRPRKAGR